ncbi:transposase [Effusibacillus dendaii]
MVPNILNQLFPGGGRPSFHPKMMLKVILYAYTNRIYSSRQIAKQLGENIYFMSIEAVDKEQTEAWKEQVGRVENMTYDEELDEWICANQKRLTFQYEKYKQRKIDVEPVFGQIKYNRGFDRFSLRGLSKNTTDWGLICIAHNLKKWEGHTQKKLKKCKE